MANAIENKEPTDMAPSAMIMMGNTNFKVAAPPPENTLFSNSKSSNSFSHNATQQQVKGRV